MGSDSASQPGIPGAGVTIAGRYLVERTLGVGGMGAVLRAQQVSDGRRVAIKVMLAEEAAYDDSTKRFFREARAVAAIDSPHVARLLDTGRLPDGLPYMVLELLEGEALDEVIRTRAPLPVEEAVGLVLQACEGVAAAHARGIVHRDLKPSNLFLCRAPDGSSLLKVLDFGISKATARLDPNTDMLSLTETSTTLGSPQYMSPEQLRSSKDVDARTDVWALGLILHKLLTGNPAFEAETVGEHFVMMLNEQPTPLRLRRPDAPELLEKVILTCLRKDPGLRWQDLAQLAEALEPFGPGGCDRRVTRIYGVLEQAGAASASHPGNLVPPSGSGRLALPDDAVTVLDGRRASLPDAVSAVPPTSRTEASGDDNTYSPVTRTSRPGSKTRRRLLIAAALGLVVAAAFGAASVLPESEPRRLEPGVAFEVAAPQPTTESLAARKDKLLAAAKDGTASEAQLRRLEAICLLEGDAACRDLAKKKLRSLGEPAPAPAKAKIKHGPPAPAATTGAKPKIKPRGPLVDSLD